MPELVGFQDSRSGFRSRDFSPDSVIFTAADQSSTSNFSLFSSASASVERCSFASDAPDHEDSVSSALSRHELSDALSGPDPDPDKPTLHHNNSVSVSVTLARARKKDKTKFQRVDSSEAETTEDENIATGSARNSFSQALKECQDRRLRPDVLPKKSGRSRPASLDLNNSSSNSLNNAMIHSSSSPRLGMVVNKQSTTTVRKTGTFPSPGTPNYRQQANAGIPKGWSSERVPPHANAKGRNSNTPLLPYNNNGRTLPSKWEDAERWIFSPVSGDGAFRTSAQQAQRRPKSKSGPLGPPGVAYYQMFSPAGPMYGGGGGQNGKLTANSPFSVGMMNADGMSVRYGGYDGGGGGGGNFLSGTEPCMARSVSIHGCSERLSQLSLPVHQDEKYDGKDDSANNISRAVSRRDMATQMSPGSSSIHSSPQRHSSFSAILPLVESQNTHFKKSEIRDVPVDERVTMTRWSKNSRGNKSSRRVSRNADDWKRKAMNFHSAGWDDSSETSQSISTIKREEAKIAAWENLQKAKAEAAIRKLEMKLEKKRSSSMDKIMNKLKSAQKKAQDMRSSTMLTNQVGHQTSRSSDVALLPSRRTRPISSLSGCFTCHAF